MSRDKEALRTHMNIEYTPDLLSYMKKKGKKHLSVEVARSDHSDFEVTELFYRFIDDKTVDYLQKKHYRAVETPQGVVMLPPYHLRYDETVTFRLKKVLCFNFLTADGISL